MVDSRAWAEKIQNEHGASCDAKVEKSTLKKGWGILKRHWSQPERAHNGQNLSNKINCDSIISKPTEHNKYL